MAKPIKTKIKLQIQAGKANPAPPVGPALGQHGLNISEICTKFNDATKDRMGEVVPVIITVYEDRTYSMEFRNPPASDLLKKAAGIEKGSGKPLQEKTGKITRAKLRELAERKLPDMNTDKVKAAMNTLAGSARQMGIEIVD